MKTRKSLLLVIPEETTPTYTDLRYLPGITKNSGRLMNAAMPTIAALTPKKEFAITVVDENIEAIPSSRYDLVGITGFRNQIGRAREIAQTFRERGSLVVCGGPSVSLEPECWEDFADVLVCGEAEEIWPEFLADYLAGKHKNVYREESKPDLADAPLPDYSGFSRDHLGHFYGGIVQTSRGCPFNCEFCDAIVLLGRKMRYKTVDHVIREIDQLGKMGIQYIFLADDNFSAGRARSKEVLRAIRDWNRKQETPVTFATQLSVEIASDEEFLELATAAGMTAVFIGIETPNVDSLKETRKASNLKRDLVADIKRFHEHGIQVAGGCVLGFDHDDLEIFRAQFDFFSELGITKVHVFPLSAPAGTALKRRMQDEGRYICLDTKASEQSYSFLDSFDFTPKRMSIDQLRQGVLWLRWRFYDLDNFTDRLTTFYRNFESSPKRQQLAFLPYRGAAKKLASTLLYPRSGHRGTLGGLVKYLAFRASWEEKKTFARMLKQAYRSSHPQALGIAVASYLSVLNVRAMLRDRFPGIEDIQHPV